MQKINKRLLKQLFKQNALSYKDIAEKIDVRPQDISNWMYRGVFRDDKLGALRKLLGIEDITAIYSDSTIVEPVSLYKKKRSVSNEEIIPYYNIDTQANLSGFWNDETEIIPDDYIHIPGLKANFFCPFYGKGMNPILNNGDWMALRRVEDKQFFNFGGLYLITTQEQVMVRYLKQSKHKSNVKLCSYDTFYDPIDLPVKSIKNLFQIVATIRREMI